MTPQHLLLLALLLSGAAFGQRPQPAGPDSVEMTSGALHLKGLLWRPRGAGPFPAVLFNHGRSNAPQQHSDRLTLTAAAAIVGPVFARHGYVVLCPFRRGEGPSADQGLFIGDLLARAEATEGADARQQLQVRLLTTDHLEDGTSALSFLQRLPFVDRDRVAVVGHSFGGGLALLEAARDRSVRAVVTFGAGAGSWDRSVSLREQYFAALGELNAHVFLLHPADDYSIAPGIAMAAELARLGKPHELKIYPAIGGTQSDAHNFLYSHVDVWEFDVFRFLDEALRH